ncbi:peptidoglycan binding domain-containing protein [Streptomyces sp. NPDC021093]|uniref:peptidoglycan binding domain-containing protein n=1 Tax=Streptomyces sp. NPDC021093 TaxID=3365112 RepID=UPI0037B2CA40
MSRETDSSSSGAQGRGSAAYPSGTPPYGSSPYPSLHPDGQDGVGTGSHDEPAEAPEADGPRTETTLTTRIRINIPGSRPIPPVVMRKPMNDGEGDGPSADGSRDGSRGSETTGETVWPPSEPLSAAPSAASGAAAPAAGAPTASGQPPLPTRVQGATVRDKGTDGTDGSGSGSGSGAASASGDEKPTSDWFAPRKAPVTPPPSPTAPATAQGGGQRDGLPYFTDGTGADGGAPAGSTGPAAPSGPTTGPVSGLSSIASGVGPETTGQHQMPGAGPGAGSAPGAGSGSGSSPWPTVEPAAGTPRGGASAPSPYGTNPLTGMNGAGGMSDDTAVLTPQTDPRDDLPETGPGAGQGQGQGTGSGTEPGRGWEAVPGVGAPGPGAPGPGTPGPGTPGPGTPGPGPMTPPGYVSGDTLTSGIPVVQPEGPRSSFPSGPNLNPRLPDPPGAADFGQAAPVREEQPAPPPAPKPAAPAKKGRSKLVLLVAGVVVVAGGVYGAGLLLNHSDVPKGTTVLGVDIGGSTKDEAVVKIDSVLGKRAGLPLQLTVDGRKTQLAPGNAGLSLDSQETVRGASGGDYNPVSVVGSLFGGERVAEPVIPVDEEKLTVALTSLAGTSGTASDASVTFSTGKPVAVPGKPGKALDVQASMKKVRDAYREQVQSGKTVPVELPVVAKQPTISQAELDRAMNEFAEPAMSGQIKIMAGGKGIPFGPAKSLPKILSMKPQGGKLVPVYDLAALEKLCDGAFDQVMITSADGTKRPVTMEDVRDAMGRALVGKTQAERTQTIPLKAT